MSNSAQESVISVRAINMKTYFRNHKTLQAEERVHYLLRTKSLVYCKFQEPLT